MKIHETHGRNPLQKITDKQRKVIDWVSEYWVDNNRWGTVLEYHEWRRKYERGPDGSTAAYSLFKNLVKRGWLRQKEHGGVHQLTYNAAIVLEIDITKTP